MLGVEDRVEEFTPVRRLSLTFVVRFSLCVIYHIVSSAAAGIGVKIGVIST